VNDAPLSVDALEERLERCVESVRSGAFPENAKEEPEA
jgi:hypothetical protein